MSGFIQKPADAGKSMSLSHASAVWSLRRDLSSQSHQTEQCDIRWHAESSQCCACMLVQKVSEEKVTYCAISHLSCSCPVTFPQSSSTKRAVCEIQQELQLQGPYTP